nr:unnamed protein product [Digitaria exilis]
MGDSDKQLRCLSVLIIVVTNTYRKKKGRDRTRCPFDDTAIAFCSFSLPTGDFVHGVMLSAAKSEGKCILAAAPLLVLAAVGGSPDLAPGDGSFGASSSGSTTAAPLIRLAGREQQRRWLTSSGELPRASAACRSRRLTPSTTTATTITEHQAATIELLAGSRPHLQLTSSPIRARQSLSPPPPPTSSNRGRRHRGKLLCSCRAGKGAALEEVDAAAALEEVEVAWQDGSSWRSSSSFSTSSSSSASARGSLRKLGGDDELELEQLDSTRVKLDSRKLELLAPTGGESRAGLEERRAGDLHGDVQLASHDLHGPTLSRPAAPTASHRGVALPRRLRSADALFCAKCVVPLRLLLEAVLATQKHYAERALAQVTIHWPNAAAQHRYLVAPSEIEAERAHAGRRTRERKTRVGGGGLFCSSSC